MVFYKCVFLLKFVPKHSKNSTYEIKTKRLSLKGRKINIHEFDSTGNEFGGQTRFTRLIIYFQFDVLYGLIE